MNNIYITQSNNVVIVNGSDNTFSTVPVSDPRKAIAVNSATNMIYVPDFFAGSMTILHGISNTGSSVTVDTSPSAVAVNSATNKVYAINTDSNNVTVVSTSIIAAIPLNTDALTFPANSTTSNTPTINLTATSTYSPTAPPPPHIYFQVDSTTGNWTQAANISSTATTLTAAATTSVLSTGVHTIYFFATDGSEATTSSLFENNNYFTKFAPETSSMIGGINAYQFAVRLAPSAANASISGRVFSLNDTPISRMKITLTDQQGELRSATTNSFGYFKFTEAAVGQIYVIAGSSKRYKDSISLN